MKYTILLKRLYIIFKSNWFSLLFKGKLISFASFEILKNTQLKIPQLNTIIDVGANNGQFAKAANYFYPKANIYSFEPIPELHTHLVAKFKNYNTINTFNLALGNQDGELTFNKNKYNHSSSFLDISENNTDFPSNKTEKIKVNITTLDTVQNQLNLQSPTLLKLDVQGFELEALKGANETLKTKIDYIIIEANLDNLYTNQPTFTQLNTFLNQNNFELETLLDFNLGKKKNYIEMDLLYKKVST